MAARKDRPVAFSRWKARIEGRPAIKRPATWPFACIAFRSPKV
jgi:hypothetical protein